MNLSALSNAIDTLNLKSCLISRNGQLVFEHYRNRQSAGQIAKINSCTKSFLSALICIGIDHGLVAAPETSLSEFYPQLTSDQDPRKQEITLAHLLTMSAGFNWSEFGGHNSFPRMTRSPDWVQFVLEQPMSDRPGDRMEYNSGASQLLSAILMQSTGMSTAKFAEIHLFGPLGIEDYKWEQDPQGVHTGGFGLWLRPADMLKFGLLYLQQGNWENKQLISQELLKRSVQPMLDVEAPNRGCYAWHWWTDTYLAPDELSAASFDFYYARGYGGQFIYILPSLDTVVVITDDKRKKDRSPSDVFREFIIPYIL
ncbi:serine hydrolase domain-containing protein [Paenibacillus puldeungensis]|uniref:Serine hydrolase domain-containing protein n=1 Tax=Paenibacillus puldeungensis TaxID=696536 RepID=A0ABW3S2R9_9BACL